MMTNDKQFRDGSSCKPASVNVLRGREREGDRSARDVAGFTPAGRNLVGDHLIARGIGAQRLGVVGLDVSGRDGVDVDTLRCPFLGEEFGQPGGAVLGGGVGGDANATLGVVWIRNSSFAPALVQDWKRRRS
jgi:hypothetical protein